MNLASVFCLLLHDLDLGFFILLMKTTDKAIQIDLNIQLDPNYAMAWYNKGSVLEQLGKTPEANAACAKAKQLVDPMDPTKKNSPIRYVPKAQLDNGTVDNPTCYWNDVEYSIGLVVCSSGQKFRSSLGGVFPYAFWTPIGTC